MENSGLCKDFPLSRPSSQPTEPQLLLPSLPDFSEETLRFFFISPFLSHNNLSASTHLCNGLSKCNDIFTHDPKFLKYLLLLFHLSLFIGFERQHTHLKILLNLIICSDSPKCQVFSRRFPGLQPFSSHTFSSTPLATNIYHFCIYLWNVISHLNSRLSCEMLS